MGGQGPRPPEGLIDVVCQAFYCTPDVALQQDARLVIAVLQHRMAKEAERMMNDTEHGVQEMAQQPEIVALWKELLEVRDGDSR